MAKLKDIEQEPIFSPNYKDPERRAISLGVILSLPTLLGIVSSRAKIIKGGVFQSVEDSINEKLSDLLAATERGGAESITSGSKAKEIILEQTRKMVRVNEAVANSSKSAQIGANIELIQNLIKDPMAAQREFLPPSQAETKIWQKRGPGSIAQLQIPLGGLPGDPSHPFPEIKQLRKTRDQLRREFHIAFRDWWWGNTERKNGIYSQIEAEIKHSARYYGKSPPDIRDKMSKIRTDIKEGLFPTNKRGADRTPSSVYNVSIDGAKITGDRPVHPDLFKAANELAEARRSVDRYWAKLDVSSKQMHDRILELALQRTKDSTTSASEFGPWSSPLKFDNVNDPRFIDKLKNDSNFATKFYNNVSKLYKKAKGNVINLPRDLSGAPTGKQWTISDSFSKESQSYLDDLLPGRSNFNATDSTIEQLTAALDDRRTGVSHIGGKYDHIINPQMYSKYKALHEEAFRHIDPVFAEAIHGNRVKAEALVKVRSAFEDQVNILKTKVGALVRQRDTVSTKQLEALAKAAGMDVSQYISHIRNLKVKLEIGADISGNMPYKHANVIIESKGTVPAIFKVPLTEFGTYMSGANSKIITSPLFLNSFVDATVGNVRTQDVGMLNKMVVNAEHYFRDLIQSGYSSPEKALHLHKSLWGAYSEQVHHEVVGITQNFIRRTKLINEELEILRGKKSARWYAKFTAGWEALQNITGVESRNSAVLALDFEFNAAKTKGFDAIQGLVSKASTRPYQVAYQLQRGAKKQLFNHWLRPDNWVDIKKNVKNFMMGQDSIDNITEYRKIEAIMEGAHEPLGRGNGTVTEFRIGHVKDANGRGSTFWRYFSEQEFQKMGSKDLARFVSTPERVRVHNEAGSFLEIAKSLFKGGAEGQVSVLTHGGEEADLILWNKRVEVILSKIREGMDIGVEGKIGDWRKGILSEVGLLERLADETKLEKLLAKGRSFDTHSMAMVVLADKAGDMKFGLTDIFEKLMAITVDSELKTRKDIGNSFMVLGDNIKNGRLRGAGLTELEKFPGVVRKQIEMYINSDPIEAKNLFGMGMMGHHDSSFDVLITDLNKVLEAHRFEQLRINDPDLYRRLKQTYQVAKTITSGRSLGHFQAMNLVDQYEMFDPDRMKRDGEFKLSLFGGSPNQAANAYGYFIGPADYIPFGRLANLQKQTYQAMSGRILPTLDYVATKDLTIETAKPILEHRLLTTAQQSVIEEVMGPAGLSAARFGLQVNPKDGPFSKRGLTTRRTLNVLYLLGDNNIVGEDTALWANRDAMKNAINFPRSVVESVGFKAPAGHPLLTPQNLEKSGMTLLEYLKEIGVSEHVIGIVEERMPNSKMSAFDFMKQYGGGRRLDLYNPEEILDEAVTKWLDAKGKGGQYIKIGDVIGGGTRGANIQTEQAKTQLTKYTSGILRNPLNSDALVKAITWDPEAQTFIFDLTAIERPGISKAIMSAKKAKPVILGMASNTIVGKGIDLITSMKKPDAAQLLDVQIRRVLEHMYKDPNITTVEQQIVHIREVMMKSFGLDHYEFDAMFTVKKTALHPELHEIYGKTHLATLEVKDYSVANLKSTNVYSKVAEMLEQQGLRISDVKKKFMAMHADVVKQVFSDIPMLEVKKQLSSLFDSMIDIHKSQLDKFIKSNIHMNIAGHEGYHEFIAQTKIRDLYRKGFAFFDVSMTMNKNSLMDALMSRGKSSQKKLLTSIFEKLTSGGVADEIAWSSASFLLTDEASILESLSNVNSYRGTLRDSYGTPIKASSTIWETLIRMEAVKGQDLATKAFIPDLLASSGIYNMNIRASLKVHSQFLNILSDGYKLPGDLPESKIYTPGKSALTKDLRNYWASRIDKNVLDTIVGEGIAEVDGILLVLEDKRLHALLTLEHGPEFLQSKEFLNNKAEYIKALQARIENTLAKPGFVSTKQYSQMSTGAGHIFYQNKNKGYQFIKFGLPDLIATIEANDRISPKLKAALRKTDLFRNEKTVFFKELRAAMQGMVKLGNEETMLNRMSWLNQAADAVSPKVNVAEEALGRLHAALDSKNPAKIKHLLLKLKIIKSGDKLGKADIADIAKDYQQDLVRGREGRLAQVMFPHLAHELPMKIDGQVLIAQESAAKINTARQIESWGAKIKEISEKLEDISRKNKDLSGKNINISDMVAELQDAHRQYMQTLARGQLEAFEGLSRAAWKSQRAYAPIMFGKAVDVRILIEEGLGSLLAKLKKDSTYAIDFLQKTITPENTNPVLAALRDEKLKTQLKNMALYEGVDDAGNMIVSEVVNAEKLTREAQKILSPAGRPISWGEYLGNTLGFDYDPMAPKPIENILKDLRLTKTFGHTSYKLSSAKGLAIGEGIMSHSMFAELLRKGNSGALSAARKPEVFREVMAGKLGLKELFGRSPLFENYFGARFRNVFLTPDKVFEEMGISAEETKKIVAVSALDIFLHGGDFDGDLSHFMMNNASMYKKEYLGRDAAWAGEVNDIQRVKQWLNFRVQQAGKSSLVIQGQNYLGVEEVDGRLLVRFGASKAQDAKEVLKYMTDFITAPLEGMSLAERNRVYMLQQVLTPIFGQKAKMLHTSYLPSSGDPAIKTEVINRIKEAIMKGEDNSLRTILSDVGRFSHTDVKAMGVEDVKKAATKYLGELQTAWDWLGKESEIPLYEHTVVHEGAGGEAKVIQNRGKWGKTRFGVFYDWFNVALIHGVPIEKSKPTGAGALTDFYTMTTMFSKLTSGTHNYMDSESVFKYFWDTNPFNKANFSQWIVGGIDIDHGLDEGKISDIMSEGKAEWSKTIKNIMMLQQAHRAVAQDTPSAAHFLLSKTPRNAIYGAQVDLLSDTKKWIHAGLTNWIGVERTAMITDAESAAYFMMNSFEERTAGNRAGTETMVNWLKKYMSSGSLTKWGGRASIGALALILFDPNTNSLLLPDLEVDGEKYDIPSFEELSKSYRNRLTKVRETSPPVIDRILSAAGLPGSIGARSVRGPALPPNPNRKTMHFRVRRKNTLDIKQYARQINGIMLGQ